jgi:hypothetical protein
LPRKRATGPEEKSHHTVSNAEAGDGGEGDTEQEYVQSALFHWQDATHNTGQYYFGKTSSPSDSRRVMHLFTIPPTMLNSIQEYRSTSSMLYNRDQYAASDEFH